MGSAMQGALKHAAECGSAQQRMIDIVLQELLTRSLASRKDWRTTDLPTDTPAR